MALQNNDVIAMTMEGLIHNQTTLNTFHYVVTTAPTTGLGLNADLDALLNAFRAGAGGGDFFESTYLQAIAQNFTLVAIHAQRINTLRSIKRTAARGTPGTVASDCEVTNISGSIEKQGFFAGRRYVGRASIPGVPVNACDNGTFTAGQQVRYTNLAVGMKTGLTIAGGQGTYAPTIFNRGNIPDNSIIQDCFPFVQIRVARRRTVGLGI